MCDRQREIMNKAGDIAMTYEALLAQAKTAKEKAYAP